MYLIVNQITQRHYIGSSRQIYRRKVTHFSKLNTNNPYNFPSNLELQYDMNLHGRDNFTFEILENVNVDNLSSYQIKKLLETHEQYWIGDFKNKKCKLYNNKINLVT